MGSLKHLQKEFRLIEQYMAHSEEYIRNHIETIDWKLIWRHSKLSETFIKEFLDKVDWDSLSEYKELSEDFIDSYSMNLNWDLISDWQKLTETFIIKHKNNINWNIITQTQILSESFIETYYISSDYDNLDNWNNISSHQKLSDEFIIKYDKKVNWTILGTNSDHELTPDMIDKYFKYMKFNNNDDWRSFFMFNKFTEEQLRKLHGNPCWDRVAYNSVLSEQFIIEFKEELYWGDMNIQVESLSEEFITKYLDNFVLEELLECDISDDLKMLINIRLL